MRRNKHWAWPLLAAGCCLCLLHPLALSGQAPGDGRVATQEEIRKAVAPAPFLPLRIICYPWQALMAETEKGLITFEKKRLREKMQRATEYLRERGVDAGFGGAGEGTSIGGMGSYTYRFSDQQSLQFIGRATFKHYQEFGTLYSYRLPRAKLELETSYQWRPQENFYGLGHASSRGKRSNFALRQSWVGLRWETQPKKWIAWGSEYKLAWLSAGPGTNPAFSSPDVFFFNLPGYKGKTRLQSVGTYLDLSALPGEYSLGGAAHLGVSLQDGLGSRRLRYYGYETRLEGRMPVAGNRSVLVGEADVELTREAGGSDPVPFYLLPRVGGSSTLRGFALDRFYGRNLALLALEYRYRIHPNIQSLLFFDEGQIFDRTSDLSWLNWHRTYGIGIRLRSVRGSFLRVEYGRSSEGNTIHISFGDRPRPPLSGPIRYGVYRR